MVWETGEPAADVVVDLILSNTLVVTGLDGRFALPVRPSESRSRHRIRTYRRDGSICEGVHQGAWTGDKNLRLRVRPAGVLRLTARTPNGVPAEIAGVVLAPLSARVSPDYRAIKRPAQQLDGSYAITGLQEGRNLLIVHPATDGWPLPLPRIIVWSGRNNEGVSEDVVLGPGRPVELRVFDAERRPVMNSRAIVCVRIRGTRSRRGRTSKQWMLGSRSTSRWHCRHHYTAAPGRLARLRGHGDRWDTRGTHSVECSRGRRHGCRAEVGRYARIIEHRKRPMPPAVAYYDNRRSATAE